MILQALSYTLRRWQRHSKYHKLVVIVPASIKRLARHDTIRCEEVIIRLRDLLVLQLGFSADSEQGPTAVKRKKSCGFAESPTETSSNDSHFASMSVWSSGLPAARS